MGWIVIFADGRIEAALLKLPASLLARFIRYAERMEIHGPDLGMPHTRAMGRGLFELRLKGPDGIARVLYGAIRGQRIVILHHFVKKSRKTPVREIEKARKRMREFER